MGSAFGTRLRSLREAKGLTLQQVADAAGCTKAYIWELEKKPGQKPSAERIQAIAKVLGITMEDLMGEVVDEATDATAGRHGARSKRIRQQSPDARRYLRQVNQRCPHRSAFLERSGASVPLAGTRGSTPQTLRHAGAP